MSIELNKGFAIIIDDHLKDEDNDDINKIAKIISDKGIPYCGYNKLNDAMKCVSNFQAINFVILDWRLMIPEDAATVSDQLIAANAKANITFLKELQKHFFAPVFIFSSESANDIVNELEQHGAGLYDDKDISRNFIFIKSKVELVNGTSLFDEINKWINGNPAVYTLKMWDHSFLQAKNSSFWHLFNRSPIWPKILWEAFEKDSVDESYNINETIYKLIKSRTSLNSITVDIIKGANGVLENEEIKQVIIGTMYLNEENIPPNSVEPGDIFLIDKKYYLNLRPICDTIPGRVDGAGTPVWDNELYLLEGAAIEGKDVKGRYSKTTGLIERITDVILFGLDNKDFVQFNFNRTKVRRFEDIKVNRKQRLLSPYINNVQQKYSSYIGRFGLPRIPDVVIHNIITPPEATTK